MSVQFVTLANANNRVLYTGITNNSAAAFEHARLLRRVYEEVSRSISWCDFEETNDGILR